MNMVLSLVAEALRCVGKMAKVASADGLQFKVKMKRDLVEEQFLFYPFGGCDRREENLFPASFG